VLARRLFLGFGLGLASPSYPRVKLGKPRRQPSGPVCLRSGRQGSNRACATRRLAGNVECPRPESNQRPRFRKQQRPHRERQHPKHEHELPQCGHEQSREHPIGSALRLRAREHGRPGRVRARARGSAAPSASTSEPTASPSPPGTRTPAAPAPACASATGCGRRSRTSARAAPPASSSPRSTGSCEAQATSPASSNERTGRGGVSSRSTSASTSAHRPASSSRTPSGWPRAFEWRRISERQAEKHDELRRQGRPRGRPAVARDVVDRIRALRAQGLSFARIAEQLNHEGIATARGGGRWYAASVRSALLTRERELAAQAA
jgi:Recombinase